MTRGMKRSRRLRHHRKIRQKGMTAALQPLIRRLPHLMLLEARMMMGQSRALKDRRWMKAKLSHPKWYPQLNNLRLKKRRLLVLQRNHRLEPRRHLQQSPKLVKSAQLNHLLHLGAALQKVQVPRRRAPHQVQGPLLQVLIKQIIRRSDLKKLKLKRSANF